MNVELRFEAGVLTARLLGEIDHHSAGQMRERIDEAMKLQRPSCLRLDFSQVPFMGWCWAGCGCAGSGTAGWCCAGSLPS